MISKPKLAAHILV